MTLTPPPVDPAHPPMNIKATSVILAEEFQVSESAVQKPVVVWTDTT